MLTDRQQQTYDFLKTYLERHGRPPKLREIAEGLGLRSRGTVHRYLAALEAAGLIRVLPGRARGIRLSEAGGEAASATSLPLLGRIAAGCPIEAIPGQERIDLSEFFVGPGRYVLRVQGDSMIEDGILDGDMVVVEQRPRAENGDIVVALIDQQEATLKRFYLKEDGSVLLRPSHPTLSPMVYSPERVSLQGVVVGQFRAYR